MNRQARPDHKERTGVDPQGSKNTYTVRQQGFYFGGKGLASDGIGNLIAVWNSYPGQDGSSDGVFGQRINRNGAPQGQEFQVNTFTSSGQWPVAVESDWVGNFLATWFSSDTRNGYGGGIYGQLYDWNGQRSGSEFQVNTSTADYRFPQIPGSGANALGTFVVAWNSTRFDYYTYQMFNTVQAQRYRVSWCDP